MEINNLLFICLLFLCCGSLVSHFQKGVGCFEDWVMVANMGLYDQSTYILSSKVYGAIDIQHLVWSCSRRVIKAPVRKSELIQVEGMKKVEADQNSMSRSDKNGHVN